MSKTAHTPTPWIRDDSSQLKCDVRGKNRRRVALCFGLESTSKPWTDEYKDECRANADLIVTAVNHHQELITRLYNLVNQAEIVISDGYLQSPPIGLQLSVNEAKDLLKKLVP